MNTKRGLLVVGASVAALVAGLFLWKRSQHEAHEQELLAGQKAQRRKQESRGKLDAKGEERPHNGRTKAAKA